MTTSTPITGKGSSNIVNIFSGKSVTAQQEQRIIRLSPEYDGLCMLYSTSKTHSEKLYSMKIMCWGLRANGDVVGLVPWLNKLLPCEELEDPVHGQYEGYYDPITESIFDNPPPHKVMELETASNYYDFSDCPDRLCIQEIPDMIGTHAMLTSEDVHSLILTEVLSWQLLKNGQIRAMLIDEERVESTPILAGDPCLYPADDNPNFRYFFQHQVANQIKSEDPDAMAAIELLFD